jgi:uncharacterized repeat protein (TIGR03803 family)
MINNSILRSLASSRTRVLAATVALLVLSTAQTACAYTFKTLHRFCSWTNCNDGENPPLDGGIRDQAGNIYGTTAFGGLYDSGVIFRLALNANGTKWVETVLKNFCAKPSCADGEEPQNDLIIDTGGSLYGTTFLGGKFGNGDVFRLTPNGTGWSFTVLHSFCAHTGCPDGSEGISGLTYAGQSSGQPWDQASPLYGTTISGGHFGNGVVFQLVHNGTAWDESVLHSFQTSNYPNTPMLDSAGNLYGAALTGGKFGYGILYKLAQGTNRQTILHNFCSERNCADGENPGGRLVMDTVGNLFGTAQAGGAYSNSAICNGDHSCGVIYEYARDGTFSVRYNFCAAANCTDGAEPIGGLTLDSSGRFFGLAASGGLGHNDGVAFSLVSNNGTWSQAVLYDFCSLANCADGSFPQGPLSIDAAGNLWGLASYSGVSDAGTAFKLTP